MNNPRIPTAERYAESDRIFRKPGCEPVWKNWDVTLAT
jgi:hypothetical protein